MVGCSAKPRLSKKTAKHASGKTMLTCISMQKIKSYTDHGRADTVIIVHTCRSCNLHYTCSFDVGTTQTDLLAIKMRI